MGQVLKNINEVLSCWQWLRPAKEQEPLVVALVGAGGKTSTMYQLAQRLSQAGERVLVATTTKIFQPCRNYAATLAQVQALWQQGHYAVVGTLEPATKKLGPCKELENWSREATVVLLEADGAKRLPAKVPAAIEPVLPKNTYVLGLLGLEALGRPVEQVCFRSHLLPGEYGPLFTTGLAADLLLAPWGTAKGAALEKYYLVLNKSDLVTKKQIEELLTVLEEKGWPLEKIWLRGDGPNEG